MKIQINEEKGLRFLLGLGLFIGGIAWLLSKVYVMTPFHTGEISVGGVYLRSGIFILPLVIGLVFWFLKPSRKWPKLLCAAAVLLIVILMITSVTVRLKSVPLFQWVLILCMIVGGAAMMLMACERKKK